MSTGEVGTVERPLRVAIIGAGPSGFYAAGQLLKHRTLTAQVDLFERLATPFGLVRAGVAPDHPKIKSVTRVYEKIAAQPGFRFFGNVEIGRDVTPHELTAWYDAVLYTLGTPGDRRSGIPGEELEGSLSATDFVGWYNGHPDFRDLEVDLSCERAVVVGNGNVAVDVARMLVLTPQELGVTDTADHAIEAFAASRIEEILVVGRRGPEQAAFTTPELLELGELADADIVVDPADLVIPEELREAELDQTSRKNMDVMAEYAQRTPSGRRKRVVLRFLTGPVRLEGDGRVERVVLGRNRLVRADDGSLKAQATGEEETVEAGLVLRAIGYTGRPIEGVPFDERKGLIRTEPGATGRVVDEDGAVIPGVYAAGWVKRGPSGVIGTNKKCAQETVDALTEDVDAGRLAARDLPGADDVERTILERQPHVVLYHGWEAIDAHERGLGEPQGRPRVKLTRVEELLDAARRAAAAR